MDLQKVAMAPQTAKSLSTHDAHLSKFVTRTVTAAISTTVPMSVMEAPEEWTHNSVFANVMDLLMLSL
jgi:hypothetical protein